MWVLDVDPEAAPEDRLFLFVFVRTRGRILTI
jgi:hypothetical protein